MLGLTKGAVYGERVCVGVKGALIEILFIVFYHASAQVSILILKKRAALLDFTVLKWYNRANGESVFA